MQRKARNKRTRKTHKIQQETSPHEQHESLLVSIRGAAHMLDRSESSIFELMRDGKLKALKSGRRTVIPIASIHEYIASLPTRGPGEFHGVRFGSAA